jgi:type I restriction enzyme M protein
MAIQTALRLLESANPDLLAGIFGDAPWTNRERLPDETLKNLIEHFSTQTLSVANVPEDELGNAYEFLIKKFADDSGHTAAEFYTNRTVVHLMTQLLAPQAGRIHLRPHLRYWRHAHFRAGRSETQRRRIPHPQALRPGT